MKKRLWIKIEKIFTKRWNFLNGERSFLFAKTAGTEVSWRKKGRKEGRMDGYGGGIGVREIRDEGENRTSGRKTGSIIALIDQPDNSISICVIQMVFNFPQRYLHSSIYISFARNCLALPPSYPFPLSWPLAFSPFFPFLNHLKTVAFRILHVVNLSPKLFPVLADRNREMRRY